MSEYSLIELGMTEVTTVSNKNQPAVRHRAPALAREERRKEIIAATLPLLREHGANVTTSQIAQAAGIAEGTVFRAFEDKQELLLAALRSAMSADLEVARIGQISSELPLAKRLLAAMAAISDYQDRLWWLMRTLQELGWRPDPDELKQDEHNPRRQMHRIAAAVSTLFPSPAGGLRLEPLPAARMLLALAHTNRFQEQGIGEPSASAEQIVDLFLHGALRKSEGTTERKLKRID
jgi:AcrR family transcriptional regulator